MIQGLGNCRFQDSEKKKLCPKLRGVCKLAQKKSWRASDGCKRPVLHTNSGKIYGLRWRDPSVAGLQTKSGWPGAKSWHGLGFRGLRLGFSLFLGVELGFRLLPSLPQPGPEKF